MVEAHLAPICSNDNDNSNSNSNDNSGGGGGGGSSSSSSSSNVRLTPDSSSSDRMNPFQLSGPPTSSSSDTSYP